MDQDSAGVPAASISPGSADDPVFLLARADLLAGANPVAGRTVHRADIAWRWPADHDPFTLDAAVLARLADRLPAPVEPGLLLGRPPGLAGLVAAAVRRVERATVPPPLWSERPPRATLRPVANGAAAIALEWDPAVPHHATEIVEAALRALNGGGDAARPGSVPGAAGKPFADLKSRIERSVPPPDGQRLLTAARARGMPAERIAGPHLRIGQGRRQVHLYDSMPAATVYGAVRRLGNRDQVWAAWHKQSLPVPPHRLVGSRQEARAAAAAIGLPVIIQPSKTLAAADRTVLVTEPDAIDRAHARAAGRAGPAVVRAHPSGNLYRLMIVGQRMVAAVSLPDGQPCDVTDCVDPDVQVLAVKAARSLGLAVAGIDLVTPDITRPPHRARATLVEATGRPPLDPHHAPTTGASRDVAGAILDSLFDDPGQAHLPTAIIVGDAPAGEAIARTAAARLTDLGLTTGLCLDRRTELAGEGLDGVPAGGALGLQALAREPETDALVAGFAADTVAAQGLGVGRCHAAALIGPIASPAQRGAMAALLHAGVGRVFATEAALDGPFGRHWADAVTALPSTTPEAVADALLSAVGLGDLGRMR